MHNTDLGATISDLPHDVAGEEAAAFPTSKTIHTEKGILWTILKVIVLVYFAWCFARSLFADSFITVINGGYLNGIYYKSTDVLQSLLRWGHYVSYIVYPMAVFFKNRLFKNISLFFCLPITIACACHFYDFINYYMADGGRGIVMSRSFREVFLAIEFALAILIPLCILALSYKNFLFKKLSDWRGLLICLPFVILALCPIYIPQSLFGYTNISYSVLTAGNFLWIFLMLLELFVLTTMYRFKSYHERFILCMFLALTVFAEYNSLFLMGFPLRRIPLQLCNIACYFFVIALIIRNQKFFNFVFLANVMGAFLAIVAPDTESGGAAEFWNVHYLLEHWHVFVLPILCMQLRIFKRLDRSALMHLVVGFTIYIVVVVISGTILNGFAESWGQNKVNFFYLFDTEKMLTYLPFVEPLTRPKIVMGRFVIYPIFQIAVYIVYTSACCAFYYIMIKLYDVLDDHFRLRKARIVLVEKLTGKKSDAPLEFKD